MKFKNVFENLKNTFIAFSDILSKDVGIEPNSRFKIYTFLYEETDITNFFYWISLLSSVGIATLGLALNSPAVIIGAMLLSPLMGPIIALGLAITVGDFYLGMRAVINLVLSIIISLILSSLITFILPFQIETPEILSRTRPNTLDLGVALICGFIASFSVARMPSKGATNTIPGVAIAVALIPPLCSTGFGIGVGFRWNIIWGAFLLFLTNLVSIVFTSIFVFLSLRMGAKEEIEKISSYVQDKAEKNRLYRLLIGKKYFQLFKKVGNLKNRLTFVGIVLLVLIIPLSIILNQIKREIVIKKETQKAISSFFKIGDILSKEILIEKNGVNIHFIILSGENSGETNIKKMEDYLKIKLNENVNISYIEVPNKAMLATAKERVQPLPPDLKSLSNEIRSRYLEKVKDLLPESRKNELINLSLFYNEKTRKPQIQSIFLTDQGITENEKSIFKKSIFSIFSEDIEISILSLPSQIDTIRLRKKVEDIDISDINSKIAIYKFYIYNPTLLLEIHSKSGQKISHGINEKIQYLSEFLSDTLLMPCEIGELKEDAQLKETLVILKVKKS